MPNFSSDGVVIRYLDEGDGEPVVLIHGFASNLDINWVGPGWVDALVTSGRRVIALDHRGHGQSAKLYDPTLYSLEVMAEDVTRLMDHVGVPRADLIGYSMGARIGSLLAVHRPERVRSLVIGGMGERLFEGAPKAEAIAEAMEAPTREAITDPYVRTFRAFAETVKGDLKALAAVMRSPRTPLTPALVARIECPVLIAVGTEDDVAGSPEGLAVHIPGAQILEIPRRDHNRAVGDRVFKEGVLEFLAQRP